MSARSPVLLAAGELDNGPVNLLHPDTLDQLGALIGRIEDDRTSHSSSAAAINRATSSQKAVPGQFEVGVVACRGDAGATSIRFWTGRHALDRLSVGYRDAWESAHPGESGHTFTPGNPNSARAGTQVNAGLQLTRQP